MVIFGLGNPGAEYSNTRHNIGFIILDHIASKIGASFNPVTKFESWIAPVSLSDPSPKFFLVKPQTFMNNSGVAVSKFLAFYKIPLSELLVIHDDVDLEFGRIKVQTGSGSAGHHGVEDIIEKIGTQDFKRIRVGIGRPDNKNIAVSDFVLQKFSEKETLELNKIAEEVQKLVI